MHEFDRGACHQRVLALHPEQRRGLDGQKRPQPFAAAEARIAHRFGDAVRTFDFAVCNRFAQQPVEQLLGIVCRGVQPRGK